MEGTYELLGPAEKHIAEQLRVAIGAAKKNTQKLLDELEKIDADAIEDTLLDSKRKESLIAIVDPMQRLASNLIEAQMIALIATVMLKEKVTS